MGEQGPGRTSVARPESVATVATVVVSRPADSLGAVGPAPGIAARRRPLLAPVLRGLLVVLAALQFRHGLPDVFSMVHSTADLAAWQVAVGVAFVTVAVRPVVVDALMPIMVGGTLMTVLVSVRDVVEARTTTRAEFSHLSLVAGFALLTMLWLGRPDDR